MLTSAQTELKSVIAIVKTEQAVQEIEFLKEEFQNFDITLKRTETTMQDARQMVNGGADIVIVEADLNDPDREQILTELCAQISPFGALIIIAEDITPQDTRALFKAGISDVLSLPMDRTEFVKSLNSIHGGQSQSAYQAPKTGKVITLMKCGGGVGTKTLAANIAHQLMTGSHVNSKSRRQTDLEPRPRVAVFDFDVQFGNVAFGLNLDNRTSILDVRKAEDRLDASLLSSAIRIHKSGLSILASPEEIVPLTAFSSEFFEQVINISRMMFDYIVIDMPQTWTGWTHSVLAASDLIIPTLTTNIEHVHNTQKILSGLDKLEIAPEKTVIIVNKIQRKFSVRERLKQIKKITDRPTILFYDDLKPRLEAQDKGALYYEVSSNARLMKTLAKATQKILDALTSQSVTPALAPMPASVETEPVLTRH